jgi:mannosyl-3-phosphoglycerate phosphatase
MKDQAGPPTLIIVTDLDATLLHEETYEAGEARPLLQFLEENGIPVVFASSKTRKEIEALQDELGVQEPFICENGGAVVIPIDYFAAPVSGAQIERDKAVIELGCRVEVLQDAFDRLRNEVGVRIRTLPEMDLEEVAALLGLPMNRAALARERQYDIPFQFEGLDTELEEVRKRLEPQGFRVVQGGRLFHLMGEIDKVNAFSRLRGLFTSSGRSVFVVALGDAENDLGMLQDADLPIVIPKKAGWDSKLKNLSGARLASSPAPRGWVVEVAAVLRERGFDPP